MKADVDIYILVRLDALVSMFAHSFLSSWVTFTHVPPASHSPCVDLIGHCVVFFCFVFLSMVMFHRMEKLIGRTQAKMKNKNRDTDGWITFARFFWTLHEAIRLPSTWCLKEPKCGI